MTDEEKLIATLGAVLPDGWVVKRHDAKTLVIDCPIADRFATGGKYKDTVEKIEKASGAKFDGGGATIGGDTYNNYFLFKEKKEEKEKAE